jgi:hypothetical protein
MQCHMQCNIQSRYILSGEQTGDRHKRNSGTGIGTKIAHQWESTQFRRRQIFGTFCTDRPYTYIATSQASQINKSIKQQKQQQQKKRASKKKREKRGTTYASGTGRSIRWRVVYGFKSVSNTSGDFGARLLCPFGISGCGYNSMISVGCTNPTISSNNCKPIPFTQPCVFTNSGIDERYGCCFSDCCNCCCCLNDEDEDDEDDDDDEEADATPVGTTVVQ